MKTTNLTFHEAMKAADRGELICQEGADEWRGGHPRRLPLLTAVF